MFASRFVRVPSRKIIETSRPEGTPACPRNAPKFPKKHPLALQMGPRLLPMAPNPHVWFQNVFLAGFHREQSLEKDAAHNAVGTLAHRVI